VVTQGLRIIDQEDPSIVLAERNAIASAVHLPADIVPATTISLD
jgi:hypothetical protein